MITQVSIITLVFVYEIESYTLKYTSTSNSVMTFKVHVGYIETNITNFLFQVSDGIYTLFK